MNESKTTPEAESKLGDRTGLGEKNEGLNPSLGTSQTTPEEIIADTFAGFLSSAERAYKEHEKAAEEVMKALEKGGYAICQKIQ